MSRLHLFIVAVLSLGIGWLVISTTPSTAQTDATAADGALPPTTLQLIGTGMVTEVVKVDLIRLDNGNLYVLDNMRVPPLFTEQAEKWLDTNLLNKKVTVYADPELGEGARDRMGNSYAHMVIEGVNAADTPRWVQGEMVGNGLAWADSTVTNQTLFKELLAIEDTARNKARGFWANPGMAVRTPDTIGADRNQFMVVSGKVYETADKGDVYFLNFGKDWKTDFTIRLLRQYERDFPPSFRIARLKDKHVRIRGWVTERNGPTIDLTHIDQLEILPDDADKKQNDAEQGEVAPDVPLPAPAPATP